MYRNNQQLITSDVHNFVLNHGALGDVITSLPAIIHARQIFSPDLTLRVWAPPWQIDLIKHLLAPYGEFDVRSVLDFPREASARKDWDGGPVSLNTAVMSSHTRCRVHMVDYAFNFLINAQPESMHERSYPTEAPVGKPALDLYDSSQGYVVFPVGATSDNKLFKASVMAPVMQWCLDNDYAVVVVGTKVSHTHAETPNGMEPIVIREEVDKLPPELFKQCIDLREKTTLLQLRDLLGNATAVVGVDGGTLHLAGTTDVPIVFASGTTLPKHRYIARYGDPSYRIRYVGPRDLECTGCQSNWPLVTLDFRFCAYGDNACMDKLHPDDFINGIKELLNE